MNELSAHRLLTIHNLRYTLDLVAAARLAIESRTFADFVAGVRRHGPTVRPRPPPLPNLPRVRLRDLEDPVTHLVLAQETAASPLPSLLFLGLMVAVFWLFIIRPQRQRAKAQQELSKTLSPGRRFGPSAGSTASWCRSTTTASSSGWRKGRSGFRGKPWGRGCPDKPEAESS